MSVSNIGQTVKLHLHMESIDRPNHKSYNVIADITGSEFPNEVRKIILSPLFIDTFMTQYNVNTYTDCGFDHEFILSFLSI